MQRLLKISVHLCEKKFHVTTATLNMLLNLHSSNQITTSIIEHLGSVSAVQQTNHNAKQVKNVSIYLQISKCFSVTNP